MVSLMKVSPLNAVLRYFTRRDLSTVHTIPFLVLFNSFVLLTFLDLVMQFLFSVSLSLG